MRPQAALMAGSPRAWLVESARSLRLRAQSTITALAGQTEGDARSTRLLPAAYALGGIAVVAMSLFSVAFFLHNKVYLVGSDTFYYVSIADSIMTSGSPLDLTSDPAQPLKTPQNAIVLVHVALARLGLGAESRLITIVLLNYVLHISAAYPLYKTARRLGLEGAMPLVALLSVYLGAFHIYRLQLLPINDGIFNSLSIWLTYLLVVSLQATPRPRGPDDAGKASNRWLPFAGMAVLLAMMVHFRINAVVIAGAAVVAAAATQRYMDAARAMTLGAVGIVALGLPYALFVGSASIESRAASLSSGVLGQLPANVFELITEAVPRLLFAPVSAPASLVYAPFALALGVALVQGFLRRDAGLLLVALSTLAAMAYVALLTAQSYRYLVYVFPFLYLLILLQRQLRTIGYLFVIVVLLSSVATFVTGFPRVPGSRFWLHVHAEQVKIQTAQPLLLAENPRHAYFFLGARAFQGVLTWDGLTSHGGVFVQGDAAFVAERIESVEGLAAAAGTRFNQRTLTPGYQDEDGNTLVELYDFEPASD